MRIKYKEKGKRDANNEIKPRCVIEEETKVLSEKSLSGLLSWNYPLMNKVRVQEYQ